MKRLKSYKLFESESSFNSAYDISLIEDMLFDYSDKDRQDDLRTRQAPKVPRRPEYKPVKINCFSCGRSYNVNPAFIVGGGYRCDRCSSGK